MNYPEHAFKTKREWMKSVRGRWSKFRREFRNADINFGSAYYPYEVQAWLNEFYKIDAQMKRYYKDA